MNRFLISCALFTVSLSLLTAGCGEDKRFRKTESTDIITMPDRLLAFERLARNQKTALPINLQQSGETDLIVTSVFIEGAEDCDRTKYGLSPGEDLPGDLDQDCQFSIASGPRNADGTPHYVTSDNPLVLGDSASRTYDVMYKATKPEAPQSAFLVIRSNALDREEVRIELTVEAAEAQITVSPLTIGFPGGTGGQEILNVRNSGTGPLSVSDVQVRRLNPPPVDPATGTNLIEFRMVEGEVPSLPWDLEPGGFMLVKLEYTPQDAGNDNAELVFISNDPGNPEFSVFMTSGELSSALQVQPNPVIFPPQMDIEAVQSRITFVNSGLDTLFVNDLVLEQPGEDYSLGNEQTSFQLVGGQSRPVTVTYRPMTREGSSASLVVRTDADNVEGGQLVLPLLPTAGEVTAISISPVVLDFGDVALGAQNTQIIELSNPGGRALNISAIRMSGEGDPLPSDAQFTITSGGGAVTLAPNETHQVSVQFARAADDQNRRIGQVIVESDAETSPDVINLVSNPPRQ